MDSRLRGNDIRSAGMTKGKKIGEKFFEIFVAIGREVG
jgi:hypothetical protein